MLTVVSLENFIYTHSENPKLLNPWELILNQYGFILVGFIHKAITLKNFL